MKIRHQQGHPCPKKSFVVILNSKDPRELQAAPADLLHTGRSGPGQIGHPALPEALGRRSCPRTGNKLVERTGLITKPLQTCRSQVCLPLPPRKSTQRARTRGKPQQPASVCPDADAAQSTARPRDLCPWGSRPPPTSYGSFLSSFYWERVTLVMRKKNEKDEALN